MRAGFSLSPKPAEIFWTGKGLPAALSAALAVGTLRGVHKTGTAPGAVLSLPNKRMMLKSVSLRYAAMQYAHPNPETGVMRISSAGMHGPLHLREGGCDELALCGIPPGLFPNPEYEMKQIQLAPGDSVVFQATDWWTRWMAKGKFREPKKSPQQILQTLFSCVEAYSNGQAQQDDRTAAVLRYSGSS